MKRATKTKSTRKWLVLWHRWFGIIASFWLCSMAVTGSVLVFYDEFDRWLNSDIRLVNFDTDEKLSIKQHLPTAQIFGTIERAYPNAYVFRIDLAEKPNRSVRVVLADRPEPKNTNNKNQSQHSFDGLSVYLNPYTAEILGERQAEMIRLNRRYIMNVIYELHLDLLLGKWMMWFLGLIALLWLIDHFISLWISFPKLKKWAASFKIRINSGSYKKLFDLHRASGIWFFPVTLVIAISSIYFNWYDASTWAIDKVAPRTPRYIFSIPKLENFSEQTDTSLAQAIEIASKRAGGKKVDMATFITAKGVHELRVFDDRDIDPYGRRLIVVDANSGKIRSDKHVLEGGPGNVITAWQYPLHSGKAFGWTGRILIFISGILLVLLCVTGIKIWLRKSLSKKSSQAKKITVTHKQTNINENPQHA